MKKEILERLEELHKAWCEVDELWEMELEEKYPFDKCFNELKYDIGAWINHYRRK